MAFRLLPLLGATPKSSLLFSLPIHSNFVGGLIALRDGRTLVSSSEDGRICVIDTETREVVRELVGHSSAVNHLALSPDGTRLASASDDRTLRIWDTTSWDELAVCEGHEDYVSRVAISAHGKIVSTSKDNTCRVWDMSGKELLVYRGHTEWILALTLVPQQPEAITVSQDGAIKRWNIDLGDEIPTPFDEAAPAPVLKIPGFESLYIGRHNTSGVGHENHAEDLLITPDGKWMVSVEKAILVHDMSTGAQRAFHGGHPWTIHKLALSRDGRRVYTAADAVKAWSLEDGHELAHFSAESDEWRSLALDPEERRLYAGSKEGAICAWDLAAGLASGPPKRHTRKPDRVALSADGAFAATAAGDGKAGVWDARTGELRGFFSHGQASVGFVAVLGDGKRGVVATSEGRLDVWDIGTGERLHGTKRDGYWFSAGAITPDGRTLVAGSIGETLTAWSLEIGGDPMEFSGETKQIGQLSLIANGTRALTTCYLGEDKPAPLQLWDVGTRTLLRSMLPAAGYHTRFVALADGRRAVAATSVGDVHVWDLETGESLRTWRAHPGYILDVFEMPEGRIATWMRELVSPRAYREPGTVRFRIWDPATGAMVREVSIPNVRHVADPRLVSGGRAALLILEHRLCRWNLETGGIDETLESEGEIGAFEISADERRIVFADSTGVVRVVEVA